MCSTLIPQPQSPRQVQIVRWTLIETQDWLMNSGRCCWVRIWALGWGVHQSPGNCLSPEPSIQISIWAIHHLELHFLPVQMCTTTGQSVCISVGFKNITQIFHFISKCLHLLMGLGRLGCSSSFMHEQKNWRKYVFSQKKMKRIHWAYKKPICLAPHAAFMADGGEDDWTILLCCLYKPPECHRWMRLLWFSSPLQVDSY